MDTCNKWSEQAESEGFELLSKRTVHKPVHTEEDSTMHVFDRKVVQALVGAMCSMIPRYERLFSASHQNHVAARRAQSVSSAAKRESLQAPILDSLKRDLFELSLHARCFSSSSARTSTDPSEASHNSRD